MDYIQKKELTEFMESLKNKMKTNIKMRVTPEQSKAVQEICFENGIKWNDGSRWVLKENEPYLFILQEGALIYKSLNEYNEYNLRPEKEIDADLFIRTNGTCKEEDFYEAELYRPFDENNILEQKLKKKNEILKKARIKRKNQREELHKLNLKLQKCIGFEEHNQVVDEFKKDINFRNETIKNTLQISKDRLKEIEQLKAENIEMGKLVNLNKSALDLAVMTKDLAMKEIEELNKQIEKINKDNVNYLSDNILLRDKEIEKLKAVIEYLESKVK